MEHNLTAADVSDTDTLGDSDDDGLQSYDLESIDDVYLDGRDGEEEGESQVAELKILHMSGEAKMTPEKFISQTEAGSFDASQALDMFQRRYTMDFGRRKSGSRPANERDEYFPIFHLDMISVIGRPLHAITARSGFFDNVTFSLQYWQAPYSSKHVASSLPFDLQHRTFRIAAAASRELWYVVMHPTRAQIVELAHSRGQRRRRQALSSRRSAVQRHHAEALAAYIKEIFLDGDLLGEGVEPSWSLNSRRSQTISYDKWQTFQLLFMERWGGFAQQHSYDPFWAENLPAFHTYDYGGNVEIEVKSPLLELPIESRLRADSEDESEEDEDEQDVGDNGGEGQGSVGQGGGYGGEVLATPEAEPASGGRHEDDVRVRAAGEPDEMAGEPDDTAAEPDEPVTEPDETATERADATYRALYSDGLEQLRSELDRKYNLECIDQISYALAADVHCVAKTVSSGPEAATVCLLSDRSKVAQEYTHERDFTFYPLAFHPRYGNFSSNSPPAFLRNLCTVMRDNMSFQNDGADVLSFGFFHAYSNLKRAIRSRPADLLATKGIATAALALPPAEAALTQRTQTKQRRLLHSMRGGLTPGQPETSTPFARERQRVEAAMEQDQLAFRMEQVVTVKPSRLGRRRRTFFSVLQPIFQLMRFFLKETHLYARVLRGFPPRVFPGVLCSYARLFELALGEMDRRFQARGDKGLDLALAEATAVLDRLGNFCFTGDPRVLPSAVLGPLVTTESLARGAWPFVSPDMLDFRQQHGSINIARWPQAAGGRPMFVHIAAVAFHYGPAVGESRHSQAWFGEARSKTIRHVGAAVRFLEEVFRGQWVPQTASFVEHQLRRRLREGARRGGVCAAETDGARQVAEFNGVLDAWVAGDEPFTTEEHRRLMAAGRAQPATGAVVPELASDMTRLDFAAALYRVCKARAPAGGNCPLTSAHATWLPMLRAAVHHTQEDDVSGQEWVTCMARAMLSAGIEWVPGSHRGRLTARHAVRLVGSAPARQFLEARPGSLKRQAMEAEAEMKADAGRAKRPRRQVVDLGCDVPFERVPRTVQEGFGKLDRLFAKGNSGVRNHYQVALNCVVELLGDPLCDLMLVLALVVAGSSVTPQVVPGERAISAGAKRKDPEMLAANLVTRMLWFLRPQAFPWDSDARGVMCVREMTKKIEHKGVNNRLLRELGWVRAKGERDSPRNSDCVLCGQEQLMGQRKRLLSLMKSDAGAFFMCVFRSEDRVWADRCSSLARDYEKGA